MSSTLALAFLFTLALSAGLTWGVRLAALRYGFVAAPREDRWHRTPTALLGGIAVYVAFLFGALSFAFPDSTADWVLLLSASAVFLLGLVDDLLPLKPQTKLIGQIVAATALAYAGFLLPFTESFFLNFVITLLWLVGITNAMNLLDNMDGLCAGVALIACAYRFAFCVSEGHLEGALLAALLGGAVAGFLFFNYNPASIFLGDSGSLFIGFMLAAINIPSAHVNATGVLSVLLFPVLVLFLPIFETAFVTILRKFSGRPVSRGGRDHSSHHLVAVGLSERRAVLILYAVAAAAGAAALVLSRQDLSFTLFFAILFALGLILFGVFLSRVRIYSEEEFDPTGRQNFFQIVADVRYKKFILLVLLDSGLILTAYYGAYVLRFEDRLFETQWLRFLESFPFILVLTLVAFFVFGVYRQDWRFTGVRDFWNVIRGVTVGTAGTLLLVTYIYRFEGYSRSVFLIFWGALILLAAGSRLSFRLLSELLAGNGTGDRRILIYGAGAGGELLLREIKNNSDLDVKVVAFLDDEPELWKTRIHGVPVVGGVETAEFWIRKNDASEIIVSTSKIAGAKVRKLRQLCDELGVDVSRSSMKIEKLAG